MTECIAYRLDSKTFATLYFGTFDSFLAGLGSHLVYSIVLPKRSKNQFNPVHLSREKA